MQTSRIIAFASGGAYFGSICADDAGAIAGIFLGIVAGLLIDDIVDPDENLYKTYVAWPLAMLGVISGFRSTTLAFTASQNNLEFSNLVLLLAGGVVILVSARELWKPFAALW